jgi:hypothetical protein
MTKKRRHLILALGGVVILFLHQCYHLPTLIQGRDRPYQEILTSTKTGGKLKALEDFKTTSLISSESSFLAEKLLPVNRLVHVTVFGLGHRLCRASSAWHLSKMLNLTLMKHQWGTCAEDNVSGPRIFSYLFGDDVLAVPPIHTPAQFSPARGKEILVRNDVYGYVPGQNFKNYRLPLNPHHFLPEGPFLSKLASDAAFYSMLRDRFVFKEVVNNFRQEYQFNRHTVLGLHLRAGNGEDAHFSESGRGIANETEFVSNLLNLVHSFVVTVSKNHPLRFSERPPLLFVATDTAYLVPFINKTMLSFGIPTAVLPQIRVDAKEGVTFKALNGAGDKCLEGWQAMVSDMLLLSYSDVLIAARRSSFTQSLPMSLVLDRAATEGIDGPHFCEASLAATTMTCIQDLPTWLFRDDESKMFIYSIEDEVFAPTTTAMTNASSTPVIHKLLVHLPDITPVKEFAHAIEFLSNRDTESSVATHTYGNKRFNPKYRNRKSKEMVTTFTMSRETDTVTRGT